MNIIYDNPCFFCDWQDKVHDFSRLNSRGLLDSTIDAVGETRLKDKHAELKDIQRTLAEGEEMAGRKAEIVDQKKVNQCFSFASADISNSFVVKNKLMLNSNVDKNPNPGTIFCPLESGVGSYLIKI